MRAAPRAIAAIAAVGGYAALYRLGLASGSTPAERSRALPGDELISRPSLVTNHAATLPAPPEEVWPWMTQVGWHRAGWYTPRWVDRLLFPDNWPSADHLDPRFVRELAAGDSVPDGAPGTAEFIVELADAPRTLVLHSRTHLPPGWDERFGAELDWVWTFSFAPEPGGCTRMLIRNRGFVRPLWLDLAYRGVIVPADHIMATGMFQGLTRRLASHGKAGRP
ncbi:MAG TPA: hypothetical protein VGK53_15190 [Propionicimonas sp.]|jgi:hypothetical protein